MDAIMDFFKWFSDFFGSEVTFWEQLQAELIIWYAKAQLLLIKNAWTVASALMDELMITSTLEIWWGQVDGSIMSFASLIRIPDAVNLLIQAHVTRFVLGIMR